jgi:hypothetical protein
MSNGNLTKKKGTIVRFDELTVDQKAQLRGAPGKDGYTPQRGIDYFTPEETAASRKYYGDAGVAPSNADLFVFEINSGATAMVAAKSTDISGHIVIPHECVIGEKTYAINYIAESGFKDCRGIESIAVPKGVTMVDGSAFENCESLKSVTLPETVDCINGQSFMGCPNITDVYYGGTEEQWTRIEFLDYTLLDSRVTMHYTGVAPDASRKRIQYYGDNSITPSPAPLSAINRIYDGELDAYYGQAANVVVPYELDGQRIEKIRSWAFSGNSIITSVTLPGTVTYIGSYAFSSCSSLTGLTLPPSISIIEERAFEGCENLTDVYYRGTEEQWNSISVGTGNEPLLNANIHFGVQVSLEAAIKEITALKAALNTKPLVKRVSITLPASGWTARGDSQYSQIVFLEGVTEYSKVDLQPTPEQLAIFYEKDVTFVTENDGGVITVYCIGQKPTNDYTMQATITEVERNE